ncbi:DUF2293 domain-containing protein [candidate division TA06 bacterium]|uniref:DUF2293 domain-containing protein n=1 Tax=candidate division TA06 bacterium TaxID=2250710 RepID=A0A523UZC6_UNCT6|nr:MAG: DUF2293 domain-containing protein [candidate division TA06 bacterium]
MRYSTDDIIVFIVKRDSECSECSEELLSGSFLRVENDKPLCLSCADLDHLEYLPSGDACLTRRSTKYTKIRAVVIKWSRDRKRYERKGILAEPEAIQRAMEDCAADADTREARRQREAIKRVALDRKYVEEFANQIRKLFPGSPPSVEDKIAEHACEKYSGRVGRSQFAKDLDAEAIVLAVQAHIRHQYTEYDELLMKGYERLVARGAVRDKVDEVLERWTRPGGKS